MHGPALSWYGNAVARLYDLGTLGDWFYRDARREAIRQLQLGPGDAVLDLFCGTGASFPLLRLSENLPVVVEIVDTEEQVEQLLPFL